jgi:hypothetical protein
MHIADRYELTVVSEDTCTGLHSVIRMIRIWNLALIQLQDLRSREQ